MNSNTKKNILIVEDDIAIQELIAESLESTDTQIYFAKDGDSAIEYLSKKHVDFTIMDINIPDIKGDTIIKLTRSNNGINKDTPFLIISGDLDNLDKNFFNAKAQNINYMQKPLDLDALVKLVKKTLV